MQISGLGLLQWLVAPRINPRYLQAIAAPGGRKLALLVGISNYGDKVPDLPGALTDVELQRELLIDRFGFADSDILVLTDAVATPEGIQKAFQEHLLAGTRSTDTVIFHFSGYGERVNFGTSAAPSLADAIVTGDNEVLSLEAHLMALTRSLATDKYTIILDTSYKNPLEPLQGNWKSRSLPASISPINVGEMNSLIPSSAINRSTKGMILKSAGPEQVAAEISGNGWNAGLFTYCLTRYLWEAMPASRITIALGEITQKISSLRADQQLQLLTDTKSSPLTYYSMPRPGSSGEAIITEIIDENTVGIIFTGLPLELLEVYENHSILELADNPDIELEILSRQGLKGKAQLLKEFPLKVGQILREKTRLLSQTPELVLAFDSSLTRIERVDATSALANLKPLVTAPNGSEHFADCILTLIHSSNSYGLTSSGGILIADTLGAANEAVKSAIKRLTPHLENLLARKIWKLTLNEASSALKVSATLEKETPVSQIFMGRVTRGFSQESCEAMNEGDYLSKNSKCLQSSSAVSIKGEKLVTFGLTGDIQYKISNHEDLPLYSLIITVHSSNKTSIITAVEANNNQFIPWEIPGKSTQTVNLKTSNVTGIVQTYLVNSLQPFLKTMSLLNSNRRPKNQNQQIIDLDTSLGIAQALWQDLSVKKEIKNEAANSTLVSMFALDKWATLSFIYQLVE
ncbi:MAG: hypothetical protein N5P05_000146 [Chroococcopsis gigantea SAG 12.99]|jgi:hypothetical protein|nr:hypothetical protein [Chroococcopsis gigantea SAG 12.99]